MKSTTDKGIKSKLCQVYIKGNRPPVLNLHLSIAYRAFNRQRTYFLLGLNGQGGIRTPDIEVRSHMLYPSKLQAPPLLRWIYPVTSMHCDHSNKDGKTKNSAIPLFQTKQLPISPNPFLQPKNNSATVLGITQLLQT